MRIPPSRRVALTLVLATAPLVVACGVLIDVAADPVPTPDRADAGQDEGATARQEGGPSDPDAAATDAEASVDACATAAVCSPERLATLGGGVLRLVVAGSSIYAAHMGGSGRHVVSLASGAPGPVLDLDPYASGPDVFRADSNIAADGSGAVYWGTPNGLRRHEPGVGADASTDAGVTDLSALGAPVSGVRVADGRLHFAVSNPQGISAPNIGHIASCALPGCSDVQTSDFAPYVLDVITVGASRWWLGTDSVGANLALRKPGAMISGEQLSPSRMATDATHIYWSTVDGLRMYTIATNMLADLLPAVTSTGTRVSGVAVDPGGTLYVTQQSNVLRCTLVAGQCSFTTLATTAGNAVDLAVDATHVYWGTTDGSIWRLRKP